MIKDSCNRIGITGSIGSGKSTVCKAFASLGIPVFNADIEAKKLYFEKNILDQVVRIAGSKAINNEGLPNFPFIASVFFTDDNIYREISNLLHPLLHDRYLKWTLFNNQFPYSIIEAAVLFESGLNKLVNYCIAVTCPETMRIQRVMARDHITDLEIRQRTQRQLSEDILILKSDFVIVNNGSIPVLPQIAKLDQYLRKNY